MAPIELTLVVAATRNMGIGRSGTLPWTGLKKEMAYFARVTKRLPREPQAQSSALNAVIMGRKTWDSIPPRFRPLKGRLNIVISRSHTDSGSSDDAPELDPSSDPIRVSSLQKAVEYLGGRPPGSTGNVFVIGGGQIYAAALEMAQARRVLLTSVMTDFDCDTTFPLQLSEGAQCGGAAAWRRKSKEELDAWAGEEVPGGVQVENDVQYEFQMWERID